MSVYRFKRSTELRSPSGGGLAARAPLLSSDNFHCNDIAMGE
jgi:hypothetical protein